MERTATRIDLGKVALEADVTVPEKATGLVLFAHGSGSSRHSPRNRHVANILNRGGIGTILADLLTEKEEAEDLKTAALRFDIPMLGRRVIEITDWIANEPDMNSLGLGYFGASTGAAAALVAAAERPRAVRAVVSRGGRPDLAGAALKRITVPVLFIVGGKDIPVLELNQDAIDQLPRATEHKLQVVPGATHLFEEPGTLDRVAILARNWFQQHLGAKV